MAFSAREQSINTGIYYVTYVRMGTNLTIKCDIAPTLCKRRENTEFSAVEMLRNCNSPKR